MNKMSLKKTRIVIKVLLLFVPYILFFSCGNRREHSTQKPICVEDSLSLAKVTFYIENSGSMFAYIDGNDKYIETLTKLAYAQQFDEPVVKEFYLTNGSAEEGSFSTIYIGNKEKSFEKILNRNGFNQGSPGTSDLNEMFKIALLEAESDSISILISDGIFDITGGNVLNRLESLTQETKKIFRNRLDKTDLQCIIVKLETKVRGDYCYVSPVKGSVPIYNQKRPYYLWIFGDKELLNKNFTEAYISSLPGYVDMARFENYNNYNPQYEPISLNVKGSFKFSRENKFTIIDAESDRNNEFQFSIAVDFSELSLPNSYLLDTANYFCSNRKYRIVSIEQNLEKMPQLQFLPTHLIVLNTCEVPYGEIDISLKNVLPAWIQKTDSEDDSNIVGDTCHTFGFAKLTNAISGAYMEIAQKNNKTNIVTLKVLIKKNGDSSKTSWWWLLLIVGVIAAILFYKNKK